MMAKKKPPKVIEAEAFRLVDCKGNIRAMLAILPAIGQESMPVFEMYDQHEQTRISIQIEPNGSAVISLLRPNGRKAIGVGTNQDGVGIGVYDDKDRMILTADVRIGSEASVRVYDEIGETCIWHSERPRKQGEMDSERSRR
jgi:hypothetical protein